MTRTIEYRRILLSELAAFEADGWEPAVVEGQAIGAEPWCHYTLATTLVKRPFKPALPAGCQGACETCDCGEEGKGS